MYYRQDCRELSDVLVGRDSDIKCELLTVTELNVNILNSDLANFYCEQTVMAD